MKPSLSKKQKKNLKKLQKIEEGTLKKHQITKNEQQKGLIYVDIFSIPTISQRNTDLELEYLFKANKILQITNQIRIIAKKNNIPKAISLVEILKRKKIQDQNLVMCQNSLIGYNQNKQPSIQINLKARIVKEKVDQ